MITGEDIETLIKAKKDQFAINVLQGLSALLLATLVYLEAFRVNHDYTIILATLSVVCMLGALGQSRWVSVSRGQLVQTLERIINTDAEALSIMATKKRAEI